jgi:xanthine dehydrogenase YagR molybdenum-binding subunit
MSAGLDSCYVPVHADIPPIDVTWLDEPDKTMPMESSAWARSG